jgi:predicted nuclease of predicted toxin-antitoxin system
MRFLAKENFPLDSVKAIRQIGHDVAWIRTDPQGSKYRDILSRALSEQRILLTFDKDFGELAFLLGLPATCGVVSFRLRARSSAPLEQPSRLCWMLRGAIGGDCSCGVSTAGARLC